VLRRARPEDCEELCRRRVELEKALQIEGISYEKCVMMCRAMIG